MNKIPQFKVWDNERKEWVKNPCLSDDNHVFTIHNIGIDFDEHGNQFGGGDAILYYDNTTICRFTGLLDRNNAAIYEGDIVEYIEYLPMEAEKRIECVQYIVNEPDYNFNPVLFPFTNIGSFCYKNNQILGVFNKPYEALVLGNKFENPQKKMK